jgi:hypothetical protein
MFQSLEYDVLKQYGKMFPADINSADMLMSYLLNTKTIL